MTVLRLVAGRDHKPSRDQRQKVPNAPLASSVTSIASNASELTPEVRQAILSHRLPGGECVEQACKAFCDNAAHYELEDHFEHQMRNYAIVNQLLTLGILSSITSESQELGSAAYFTILFPDRLKACVPALKGVSVESLRHKALIV